MAADEIKKATRGGTIFMHYAPGYDALLYIMTHYDALRRGYVNQLRRESSMNYVCEDSLSRGPDWAKEKKGGKGRKEKKKKDRDELEGRPEGISLPFPGERRARIADLPEFARRVEADPQWQQLIDAIPAIPLAAESAYAESKFVLRVYRHPLSTAA